MSDNKELSAEYRRWVASFEQECNKLARDTPVEPSRVFISFGNIWAWKVNMQKGRGMKKL